MQSCYSQPSVAYLPTFNRFESVNNIMTSLTKPSVVSRRPYIPRPQLMFKDRIDNSKSLWVPKICYKPNSITPLTLSEVFNNNREVIGYEHPYKAELEVYRPPRCFIEPDAAQIPSPEPLEETSYTFVDSEDHLNALVHHLTTVSEFAVDLEHNAFRSYQGVTCLIQITTEDGGDFIIDTLAIREHIHKMNEVFTDPRILKIFHGADNDVLWLQRDFGVYVVGLFDTHQAAQLLLTNDFSLKHLVWEYCGIHLEKKYTFADWRMRPLSAGMVEYARSDTHYLIYIWRQMKKELLQRDETQLLYVFKKSRKICSKTYVKKTCNDNSCEVIYRRFGKSFNARQMAALRRLYKWRDTLARALDEGTSFIMPDHVLLSLAEDLPDELQDVYSYCAFLPKLVKRSLMSVHRMILSCRELPLDQNTDQTFTIVSKLNVHAKPFIPPSR